MGKTTAERIPVELLEQLRHVSAATACGTLQGMGYRNTYMEGLQPLAENSRFVGRAVTLRYLPWREDLAQEMKGQEMSPMRCAIESLEPGDVLVIDAGGDLGGGTIGDVLASRIQYLGAVAVVVDGAVRDSPFLRRMGLPIYVRGVHAAAGRTVLGMDVNIPVRCGGVTVVPGDVILGDEEGAVVIPRALAEQVAREGLETERKEVFIREKIRQGAPTTRVYPMDEATLKEYEEYKKARGWK